MRGNLSVPHGESPWGFDPDKPPQPLPRAAERDSGGGSAETLLGGLTGVPNSEQAFQEARRSWPRGAARSRHGAS